MIAGKGGAPHPINTTTPTTTPEHCCAFWPHRPTDEAAAHGANCADDHLRLDEVSNLRAQGYAALLITSHGAQGTLAHWHRVTDTLENLNLHGLSRAAQYTGALLQTRDALE